MWRRLLPPWSEAVAVLVVASLLLAGCSSDLKQTNPKLPPGFSEIKVPPGDIAAYLYLSQGAPVEVPMEWFQGVPSGGQGPVVAFSLAQPLRVDRLSVWAGSTSDSFAGSIQFQEQASAEAARTLLAAAPREVTGWLNGTTLQVVSGSGEWAGTMKEALQAGKGTPFQEAYPAIWDLLRLMPEAPPGKPVAVGFVHVNEQLMSSLATDAGLELRGLGQALGAVNVSDMALMVYADAPLVLPAQVGPEYFEKAGLGAILVARSTYPGFVLSFFLGSFAEQMGLSKGPTIKSQEVLTKEIQGAHLMVVSLGNVFFVSLAPTLEKAQALISSALEPHVKG